MSATSHARRPQLGRITVLPWLLGYGIARVTRALSARRNRPAPPQG
ncbi:hypothetical protein ABZ958_09395 [Streptomyces sp. NPDC046237]